MKAPSAGNTADSLRGIDVFEASEDLVNSENFVKVDTITEVVRVGLPTAEDLDAAQREAEIVAAAQAAIEADPELKAQLEADNLADDRGAEQSGTEYVPRAEFDALILRIEAFNKRSGHQI